MTLSRASNTGTPSVFHCIPRCISKSVIIHTLPLKQRSSHSQLVTNPLLFTSFHQRPSFFVHLMVRQAWKKKMVVQFSVHSYVDNSIVPSIQQRKINKQSGAGRTTSVYLMVFFLGELEIADILNFFCVIGLFKINKQGGKDYLGGCDSKFVAIDRLGKPCEGRKNEFKTSKKKSLAHTMVYVKIKDHARFRLKFVSIHLSINGIRKLQCVASCLGDYKHGILFNSFCYQLYLFLHCSLFYTIKFNFLFLLDSSSKYFR